MPKCNNCGRVYADWRDECPDCGFHTPKKSKPITPYLAAIGIIGLVITVFILFGGGGCLIWGGCNGGDGGGGGGWPDITPTTQQTPPPCHVQVGMAGITANKMANGKIRISVMGDPKASLVHDFTILLNDATLDTTLGLSSGSTVEIQGTGGSDNLRIVANSTCGVSTVILNQQL